MEVYRSNYCSLTELIELKIHYQTFNILTFIDIVWFKFASI